MGGPSEQEQSKLPLGSCHSICIVNTSPEFDHWAISKVIEFVL